MSLRHPINERSPREIALERALRLAREVLAQGQASLTEVLRVIDNVLKG